MRWQMWPATAAVLVATAWVGCGNRGPEFDRETQETVDVMREQAERDQERVLEHLFRDRPQGAGAVQAPPR